MKIRFIFFNFLLISTLLGVKIQAQTDGILDTSFIIGNGFNGGVNTIALQSDGKILVGGNFTDYNGTIQNRITRLNTNGNLDISFNIGMGFDDKVRIIAVQNDGKILVGGEFQKYNNGPFRNGIVRLNVDGSLDSLFTPSTFNGYVGTIAIQADGKILLGGNLERPNGTSKSLIRLNIDGSLDTSFATASGFNSAVKSIMIQPDGKILTGGMFTSYNGINRIGIARLNIDGSLDNSFVVGNGFYGGDVNTLALQADGKILAGGDFDGYNGQSRNYIARLGTNGNLDTSFIVGASFSNDSDYTNVASIVCQPDGKILVGGTFNSFKNIRTDCISRLNIDGSLDSSLLVGTGFYSVALSSSLSAITLQPDGKILAGGGFNQYNGINRKNLVRLRNDKLSVNDISNMQIIMFPNPVRDLLSFSDVVSNIEIQDSSGKSVIKYPNSSKKLNLSKLSKGIYFISGIEKSGNQFTKKIIKE